MQAGRDTITIRQDSSDIVRWVFSDDAGLIDWTGWSARVQVRREADRAAELLAELSTVDGTIVMGADGGIDLDFTVAIMAAVPVGQWSGDLRVVSPAGRPDYPMTFTLIVPATTTEPQV